MKQIKRSLKPKYIVVAHRNDCGDDDAFVLGNDEALSETFSSLTKAKKRMKRDIKEFRDNYPEAVLVSDIGGMRVTFEISINNERGKPDTLIGEWMICEV